jgi:hypothetical protein
MNNTLQNIELGAQQALGLIQAALPVIEAIAPAGGPVGMGIGLAAQLLPLLAKIPVGTVISVDEQASLVARIRAVALLDFSHSCWQVKASSTVNG